MIKMFVTAAATAIVAAGSGSAHAMGAYTRLSIVAWSEDGASALVVANHSSSGTAGSSDVYALVGAGDAKATTYTFFDEIDPDHATEHVTVAECRKSADALAGALAAHRFKGVTVRKAMCGEAARAVVSVDAATAERAERSWVAVANARPASAREEAALAIAKKAQPDAEVGTDVATTTGKLVIVMWGQGGDSTGPKNGAAYAASGVKIDEL